MFLNQIAQMPVVFGYDNIRIAAPKFTTQDWLAWAQEIDAVRREEATKDLTPETKFRLLNFYVMMPTTLEDLKAWVTTPKGTQRVCRVCLQRSRVIAQMNTGTNQWEDLESPRKITADEVSKILIKTIHEDLLTLAKELSDLRDTSKPTEEQEKAEAKAAAENKTLEDEGDKQGEQDIDPLSDNSKFALAI